MVISKARKFLNIRLSEIKSGGICAGCACQFESRIFYKLRFLRLNLNLRVKLAIFSIIILGKLGFSDIEWP